MHREPVGEGLLRVVWEEPGVQPHLLEEGDGMAWELWAQQGPAPCMALGEVYLAPKSHCHLSDGHSGSSLRGRGVCGDWEE